MLVSSLLAHLYSMITELACNQTILPTNTIYRSTNTRVLHMEVFTLMSTCSRLYCGVGGGGVGPSSDTYTHASVTCPRGIVIGVEGVPPPPPRFPVDGGVGVFSPVFSLILNCHCPHSSDPHTRGAVSNPSNPSLISQVCQGV